MKQVTARPALAPIRQHRMASAAVAGRHAAQKLTVCLPTLHQVLEERRRSHPQASAQPRVLFTVPVGHNPTGEGGSWWRRTHALLVK